MSDKKNYDDHPCFECARKGEGGATYDFPHPAVKCIVDNHRSLDILGDLRICLDGLYRECPKNREDIDDGRVHDYDEFWENIKVIDEEDEEIQEHIRLYEETMWHFYLYLH